MGHESAIDPRLGLRNRPPLTAAIEVSSFTAGRVQMFSTTQAFEVGQNLEAVASAD
jgi:hypothetical protein